VEIVAIIEVINIRKTFPGKDGEFLAIDGMVLERIEETEGVSSQEGGKVLWQQKGFRVC